MDKLLAKLSEQQAILAKQNAALKSAEDEPVFSRTLEHASSSNSLPVTPATDAFPSTAPTTRPASASLEDSRLDNEEVLRLKLQLAQAQNEITKLDQELAHTRTGKAEPEPTNFGYPRCSATNARDSPWGTPEDAQSDTSDGVSATNFNRTRGIWNHPKASFASTSIQNPVPEPSPGTWFGAGARPYNQGYPEAGAPYPIVDNYRSDRLSPDSDMLRSAGGRRANRYENRFNSPQPFGNGYGGYSGTPGQADYMGSPIPGTPINAPQGLSPMNLSLYPQYQPQPIGTPLSPHASEFTSKGAWNSDVGWFLNSPSDELTHV